MSSKAQATLQLALQHHQAGRFSPAAALYAQLRQDTANHFEAHHLGGAVALQQGKPEEARALLEQAVRLRPQSAPTLMCLGLAQAQMGHAVDAEKSLRKSIAIDPKNFETWANLASVLTVLGKLEAAAQAYRSSLELRPNYAQGWTGLGSVLLLLGRPTEAIAHHTKALQFDPRHPKAQCARAQARQSLHQVDKALQDFEAHLQREPGDLEALSLRLYLLNYSSEISREKLYEEHRRFGARFATVRDRVSRNESFTTGNEASMRRLRVGFLSPDLRAHSVTYFLEPVLKHSDPAELEIYLYHDHFSVDCVSQRLATHAAVWRNFIGRSAAAVASQIREDQLDVLIDLAGHTGFNRMPIFAQRLAPVQISYLGYPNTTGLEAMDFRLTDALADPQGDSDAIHTEKLIRFSPTAWSYQPPENAPAVVAPPCATNESFAFGSFNNASKVNHFTLALWARVLRSVPKSKLILKSLGLDEIDFRKRASAAGIAEETLCFLPHALTTEEHLAAYAKLDVALDPFPYHGTTTTCEALWMGVPVVTLCGDRHASRVGASLLTAVGHPDWIAQSADEYLQIASSLATDRSRLAFLRGKLRHDVLGSVLLDHVAQAKRFAAAIRRCWESKTRRQVEQPVQIAGASQR